MDWGLWLERLEWCALALVALFAAALHARFVTEVGGLWRDETNSVNLATLPTFAEVWRFLDYDSFPVLYFAVLRAWTGIFGAGNDEALRALGLLIGLGGLAVLWANARAFGGRLPLLSFALVGLNPMIVRYGDSNRAYGLGILLILLTLRSFWRLVQKPAAPSTGRITIAAIFAVLSVQCLYYNSVLLLAIAAGAVAVAVRARGWRTVGIILGIGALAAASLLPYAPIIIRMREWTFLVSYPATFSWLWRRAGEVMGSPHPHLTWLWVGLTAVGLGAAIVARTPARLKQRGMEDGLQPHDSLERLPAAVLFAAVALVAGVAGYAVFLRMLNYYTQPWYYVTLAAFAACALDAVFGAWPAVARLRVFPTLLRGARIAVALLLIAFAVPLAWEEMSTRHTNVDLIAARIEKLARKGDLILVSRWECAITFSRYYQGPAEVVTLPPLEDHRLHRYDAVLRQMMAREPHQPVLARMGEVLRSGHRVFFAGSLPFDQAHLPPPTVPPMYRDPNGGWHGAPFNAVWQLHAAHFLRTHAAGAVQIQVPVPGGVQVQKFENLYLGLAEGWR